MEGVGGSTTAGPFEAISLDEEKAPVAKPAKTFMAKSAASAKATVTEKRTKEAEKSEIAQSQVVANLHLYAETLKSNPAECAGVAILGAAFSAFVFFVVRHRRTVETGYIVLA